MADQQEEEDLKVALKMSMHHTPPKPKRSKPRDGPISGSTAGESSNESPEAKGRRLQRRRNGCWHWRRGFRLSLRARVSSPMATNKNGEVVKDNELGSGGRDFGRELSFPDGVWE